MGEPDGSKTLYDIGTTWLGLAVTTAYAYFGLDPARSAEEISRLQEKLKEMETKLGSHSNN